MDRPKDWGRALKDWGRRVLSAALTDMEVAGGAGEVEASSHCLMASCWWQGEM